MATANTTTTTARKKTSTKPASKKPSSKGKPSKVTTPPASPTPTKKRTRNANPLYAEVTLGKLKELLADDDTAKVTVSRNFVLAIKKAQLEAAAEKDLGI
jgi:hypothetical protein